MPARSATAVEASGTPAQRRWDQARILVYNVGQSRCDGGLGVTGKLGCGPNPTPTELTWQFFQSSASGDVYRITRTGPTAQKAGSAPAPIDEPAVTNSQTKEFTFSGHALKVFEDSTQRVWVHSPDTDPEKPSE